MNKWIVRRGEGMKRVPCLFAGLATRPIVTHKDERLLQRIADAHNAEVEPLHAALARHDGCSRFNNEDRLLLGRDADT